MNAGRLREAYHRAEYCVPVSDGWLRFKVGQADPEAESVLAQHLGGLRRSWAILTPCNPHSRRLGRAENAARLAELGAALQAAGWRHCPSLNLDPEGRWPDEPGYCIADAPEAELCELGRRHGQNALLVAACGGAPRLLWLVDQGG